MSKLLYSVASFYEKLRSNEVRQAINLLEKGNQADRGELEELRNDLFINLIKFVYTNNEFYKERIQSLGYSEKDFTSLQDIKKLPVLTKDDIKSNRNILETSSIDNKNCSRRTSGGTTGEPIFINIDAQTRYMELYAYYRGLDWMGYKVGEPMVKFFGGSLGGNNSPTFRSKIKRIVTGEVFLPAFDLNRANALTYLNTIKDIGATFLQGYVSSLYSLAIYAKELNYKKLKIRGVFTTAEQLPLEQSNFMAEVFDCEVKSFYGCAEMNCLGFQELSGGAYTVPSELVYIENTQHPKLQVDNAFLITSLHNKKTPLIRYLNGDNGILDTASHRYDQIVELSGRTADMFIKPNGSMVSSIVATQTMQITGLTHKIKRYQLVQDDVNHITLFYEPFAQELLKEDIEKILIMYQKRVGEEFTITPVQTDRFMKSSTGKHRLMVNTYSR